MMLLVYYKEDIMDFEKELQKEKELHAKTLELLKASNLLLETERALSGKLEKQVATLHRELSGNDDVNNKKKEIKKPDFKKMF